VRSMMGIVVNEGVKFSRRELFRRLDAPVSYLAVATIVVARGRRDGCERERAGVGTEVIS
jgi:hypothetical protein